MRSHQTAIMLLAALSAAALAACSSDRYQAMPGGAAAPSFHRLRSIDDLAPAGPSRSQSLVFVRPSAIAAQTFVAAYNPSGSTPVDDYNGTDKKDKGAMCQITAVGEGINSIGVDPAGELWIPQGLDPKTSAGDVVSFAPNCGARGSTLAGLKGQPAGIAFAADGTRYVNEIVGASSTAGDIAVFPKGKKKPARYLTNSKIFFANGVGVDSKGNVFVSYFSPSSATGVMEFKGGQMPGTVVKGIKNGAPGAIAFDAGDNLIITDDAAVTLDVYAPPYSKPPKSYPLQGHSPQCSLNKSQTNLACGDKTNTSVDIFSYPAGKYLYSFSTGLLPTVIGTAQDPQ